MKFLKLYFKKFCVYTLPPQKKKKILATCLYLVSQLFISFIIFFITYYLGTYQFLHYQEIRSKTPMPWCRRRIVCGVTQNKKKCLQFIAYWSVQRLYEGNVLFLFYRCWSLDNTIKCNNNTYCSTYIDVMSFVHSIINSCEYFFDYFKYTLLNEQ